MKRAMIGIGVAISVFVIGCQDANNSPIGSEVTSSQAPLVKISANNPNGIIPLATQLTLGEIEGVDNTYNVTGEIHFSLVAADQGSYSFALVTTATLRPLDEKGAVGTVYNESNDMIVVPTKEYVLFKKILRVADLGEKEVDLNIILAISETDVKVESVWLSQPNPILSRTK